MQRSNTHVYNKHFPTSMRVVRVSKISKCLPHIRIRKALYIKQKFLSSAAQHIRSRVASQPRRRYVRNSKGTFRERSCYESVKRRVGARLNALQGLESHQSARGASGGDVPMRASLYGFLYRLLSIGTFSLFYFFILPPAPPAPPTPSGVPDSRAG